MLNLKLFKIKSMNQGFKIKKMIRKIKFMDSKIKNNKNKKRYLIQSQIVVRIFQILEVLIKL
jgi:acid phosphatase class B